MRTYITLLTILFSHTLFAQVKVSGTVKDKKGHAIIGASITLKDTYDGALSDSTGKFSFKTTEKGSFVLEVKSVGYGTVAQTIAIDKTPVEINFSMKEEISELKAVVVTAGSFAAGDKKRGTVLTSLDIVTTGGANGDITNAMKTLPGAQQVGEQEGLFVRGGAGYETKQYIDGTVVNNPYYSSVPDISQRGRFSPNLFKGTVFSTGGYSALYGQALSSALILESIDMPERSEATASISTVFLGAGFQHVAKNKKSSFGGNYGYTNLYPYFQVVSQTPDYFSVPQFHTADANFRIRTKRGGFVKYYTTFAHNQLGLRRPNINDNQLKDAFSLKNTNWYNNVSWRESLSRGWKFNLGLSYSTNKDNINQQIQNQQTQPVTTGITYIDSASFGLKNQQDLSQIKVVFEKKLSGLTYIRFGTEYWYAYNNVKYNNYNITLRDHFNAAFAESDIYLTNDIAAKVGARFEYSSIIQKANIAPRLSLAYKTGKYSQVSAAYGIFYQKPENNLLQYTTQLGYTKATHYILNYQKMNALQTFRVEAFYKTYDDLVKIFPQYNNSGDGYARGIELFWRDRKSISGFDYWISYSYLDTKRDYLNYPNQLQPNFAAHHTASIVTKKFVTAWKTGFNLTYSFATGRPYYFMQTNGAGTKYEIKDQGTTKAFNTVGFSLNYLPNLGKKDAKTFIVLVASVTNLFNFKQVYGYNYNHDGSIKQAITPPAPQFFFIGCFLSWGVDRSDDAINNNL